MLLQGALEEQLFCNVDVVSSLLNPLFLAWPQIWPSPVKGPGRAYHCSMWGVLSIYQTCLARTMLIPSGWTWFVANVGLWRHSGGLVGHLHKRTVTPPPSPPPQSPPQSYNTQKDFYSCEPATTTIGNRWCCKGSIWIVSHPFFSFFLFFLLFVESVAKPSSWSFHFSPVCRQGKTDLDPLLCFASNFLFHWNL